MSFLTKENMDEVIKSQIQSDSFYDYIATDVERETIKILLINGYKITMSDGKEYSL